MIYFKEKKGILYNGDALWTLRNKVPENKVDLIITSPPYNLGTHHANNKKISCYEDNLPEDVYQKEQVDVLQECYRVLKKDGSIFYNHKNRQKNLESISPYLWLFITDFIIKQELVWVNRSRNFAKIRFYPWTERVYWMSKSKTTQFINLINESDYFDWRNWKPDTDKGVHKRTFPLQMPFDIISCFPDSKVILDPYFGSGTVGLAAKMLSKRYIGIEKARIYCKEAKTMLSLHLPFEYFDKGIEDLYNLTNKVSLSAVNQVISDLVFDERVEYLKTKFGGSLSDDSSQFTFPCERSDFIKLLIDSITDKHFHEACLLGDTETAEYLIDSGTQIHIENIALAKQWGHHELVYILTEKFIVTIGQNENYKEILKIKEYLTDEQKIRHAPILSSTEYNI